LARGRVTTRFGTCFRVRILRGKTPPQRCSEACNFAILRAVWPFCTSSWSLGQRCGQGITGVLREAGGGVAREGGLRRHAGVAAPAVQNITVRLPVRVPRQAWRARGSGTYRWGSRGRGPAARRAPASYIGSVCARGSDTGARLSPTTRTPVTWSPSREAVPSTSSVTGILALSIVGKPE
jgi:hypothetical protein